MNRQYIGAKYVPTFFNNNGSNEWVSGIPYEALTIVTYMRNSYTSRIPVPPNIGNPISESGKNYWVLTGAFNKQLEDYYNELNKFKDNVHHKFTDVDGALEEFHGEIVEIKNNYVTSSDIDNAVETAISNLNIESVKDLSLFKNKKICIIGDSLSDNATNPPNWTTHFTNTVTTVGATVRNIAQDGSSFASWVNKVNEIPNGYDIYIVFLGVNDFQGQFSWTTGETNNVIDSCYIFFASLMDKGFEAKYYYVSPLKYWYSGGINNLTPLSFFRHYYEMVAASLGICVISGYNAWSLSVHTKSVFMPDDLHPSAMYAPILASYLLDAMISGVSSFSEQPVELFKFNGFNISLNPNTFEMLIDINKNFSTPIQQGWLNIAPLPRFFSNYRHVDLVVPAEIVRNSSGANISETNVLQINVNNSTGYITIYIKHANTTILRTHVRLSSHVLNRVFNWTANTVDEG